MEVTETSSILASSTTTTPTIFNQARQKGHYRSSSLENNTFNPIKASIQPNTSFTGTLKSQREQKRISDFLSKHNLQQQITQNDSSTRKAHFENIREIFEKNHQKVTQNNKITLSKNIPNQQTEISTNNSSISDDDIPPKIQACSGILGKGKQVIRPIAFKPVPLKSNTPNYGGRLTDLGNRYGSTPSLRSPLNMQHKFGSSTDLLHNYHYSTLIRKHSSIPFKTYDSLESILKLPDNMTSSYPSTISGQSMRMFHEELMDMTPSPSDSGMSELEAALRDRDSELAYLRQTMEHNEHVIFRVHQDKEKHWEQELNRLKAIHESRLRAGAQKVHKLEQLLMMQTFQLRQDKKRLQEDIIRLHSELNMLKAQNDHQKNEMCQMKINAKDSKEQNSDLMDEIQMLRRVVGDLKGRMEESEWNLCQRNGELAIMKTQLKDSQTDTTVKDHEIVQLRANIKAQNHDEIIMKKSEIKKELDFDLEISQLNRIIIFKDQIIVVMNNEIQKLRKELSDISILNGYEGAPSGRYSRFKKSLDTNEIVNNNFEIETLDEAGKEKCCIANEPKDKGNEKDEIIKNYMNNQIDLDKKLFINTQICNYSDEDKSNIIENYNCKNLPDITLNLNCFNNNADPLIGDNYVSTPEEGFQSMTQTTEPHEVEFDSIKKDDEDVNQLKQELLDYKNNFETERLKWSHEKEKVIVYQRQLQQNYLEMSKKTQVLEEKLKSLML